MACNKCGAPCHGRLCQTHRIEAAHEGMDKTAASQRTLEALREAREDDDDDQE